MRTRLRALHRPRLLASGDLATTENVVYGEAPAPPGQDMPPGGVETLLLDVVMPRLDVDAETGRPVIPWIHGGGSRAGSKA
jgi:acetyl esterase/lipase